jgi:hypothetical protein
VASYVATTIGGSPGIAITYLTPGAEGNSFSLEKVWAAQPSIQLSGNNLSNGVDVDVLYVGNKIYEFTNDAPVGDQIQTAVSTNTVATRIAAKINADTAETLCAAAAVGSTVNLTANEEGEAGNSIPLDSTGRPAIGDGFSGGINFADAVPDPVEPLVPINLRLRAEGGSVEAGTPAHPFSVQLVDGAGHVITFVDDGDGGWAIPVKVIP